MVAALYVDPRGPYPGLCEAWDEARDARLYEGPGAVVAHPPCGPWSSMRHLYRGGGMELAPRALLQVRKWGGVLEHPARSALWAAWGLPKPPPVAGELSGYDRFGGYALEVAQVDWGHPARKRTWLYVVGVPRAAVVAAYEARPHPGRLATHWASGSRGESKSRKGWPVPPGVKVCSARQRRRTPPAFAEWLLQLAGLVSL